MCSYFTSFDSDPGSLGGLFGLGVKASFLICKEQGGLRDSGDLSVAAGGVLVGPSGMQRALSFGTEIAYNIHGFLLPSEKWKGNRMVMSLGPASRAIRQPLRFENRRRRRQL
jgi:hypothetical protein